MVTSPHSGRIREHFYFPRELSPGCCGCSWHLVQPAHHGRPDSGPWAGLCRAFGLWGFRACCPTLPWFSACWFLPGSAGNWAPLLLRLPWFPCDILPYVKEPSLISVSFSTMGFIASVALSSDYRGHVFSSRGATTVLPRSVGASVGATPWRLQLGSCSCVCCDSVSLITARSV